MNAYADSVPLSFSLPSFPSQPGKRKRKKACGLEKQKRISELGTYLDALGHSNASFMSVGLFEDT